MNENQLTRFGLEPTQLIRLARGLEAGGLYNAAKLFRTLAFSEEIRFSNIAGLPTTPDEQERQMTAVAEVLRAGGVDQALVELVENARRAAAENRTILASEIPALFVCRTCGHIATGERPESCPNCGARDMTFREVPGIYWLELYRPSDILTSLAVAVEILEEAVSGRDESDLARSPEPGEWGVRGLLWHLLVAEGLLYQRVKLMLAEDDPPLEALAAWAVGSPDELSTVDMLERWQSMRLQTLERLEAMEAADWWRTGVHQEFGRVTILQQASYFAIHTLSHLPQLEAILTFLEGT